MKGTIDTVQVKVAKNGNRFVSLSIEGCRYAIWDPGLAERYRPGDIVEYKFEQKGRFADLTYINLLERPETPPAKSEQRDQDDLDLFVPYEEKKDRQIARMSCLKSAATLVSNYASMESDLDTLIKYAIDVSKTFEKYVVGETKKRKKKTKEPPTESLQDGAAPDQAPSSAPEATSDIPF